MSLASFFSCSGGVITDLLVLNKYIIHMCILASWSSRCFCSNCYEVNQMASFTLLQEHSIVSPNSPSVLVCLSLMLSSDQGATVFLELHQTDLSTFLLFLSHSLTHPFPSFPSQSYVWPITANLIYKSIFSSPNCFQAHFPPAVLHISYWKECTQKRTEKKYNTVDIAKRIE